MKIPADSLLDYLYILELQVTDKIENHQILEARQLFDQKLKEFHADYVRI